MADYIAIDYKAIAKKPERLMKKKIGNIEVETFEATNCGESYVVGVSFEVRTSTVRRINLSAEDARDLIHGLQWALRLQESSSAAGDL